MPVGYLVLVGDAIANSFGLHHAVRAEGVARATGGRRPT